ncbi:hypothetical protein GDO81_027856 [Engystomops pustulosus]|uniref:Secreted protein n=1 Tax=Engystomops pustulosus TaxID=76066 RepID=A0AAV6YX72_ENGPU|nr:hypothetical protein GDO81_027856 [Engystomops pustulosus]
MLGYVWAGGLVLMSVIDVISFRGSSVDQFGIFSLPNLPLRSSIRYRLVSRNLSMKKLISVPVRCIYAIYGRRLWYDCLPSVSQLLTSI